MTKLLETMSDREASRARVLELRRVALDKRKQCETLAFELAELVNHERAELRRLVDLTSELAKLAHADLAGIAGRSQSIPAMLDAELDQRVSAAGDSLDVASPA